MSDFIEVELNDDVLNQLGYNVKRDEENKTMTIYKNGEVVKIMNIPFIYEYEGKKYKIIKIADKAFRNCKSLEKVYIAEGVKYIGGLTFKDCRSLFYIDIPNSMVKVCRNAFKGCPLTGAGIDITKVNDQVWCAVMGKLI